MLRVKMCKQISDLRLGFFFAFDWSANNDFGWTKAELTLQKCANIAKIVCFMVVYVVIYIIIIFI